jgi:probable HAF family extracellular repeat protein
MMLVGLAILTVFVGQAFGASGSFRGLGDSGAALFFQDAQSVSANGSAVAGNGWNPATGSQPVRWTWAGGIQGLGLLPGGDSSCWAKAISADGNWVAGAGTLPGGYNAWRWSQGTGMVPLGDLSGGAVYSEAFDIANGGSTVVGWGQTDLGMQAFRWTPSGGMQPLPALPSGGNPSEARALTPDGSVIVGGTPAWRRQGGVTEEVKDSGGLSILGAATAVSPDGSILAGSVYTGEATYAFLWTPTGKLETLGDLPGGLVYSEALAVSGDGSVVVGYGTNSANELEAFIWDRPHGLRSLKDALVSEFGLTNLAGWTLAKAQDITPDGLTVVGYGIDPSGQQEAWMARLPEPATLALVAVGGVALLRRRMRRAF